MERLRFGRWELSCDPVTTKSLYAGLEPEVVRSCECFHCQDYRLVAETLFPAEAKDLLARLGIDHRKEAKVENSGVRPEDGVHIFDGWYSFVGRVESGGDAGIGGELRDPEGGVSLDNYEHEFELVGSDLAIGFTGSADYIIPTLGFPAPVAHLIFAARVPWVIDYDDDCDHFHRFFEK